MELKAKEGILLQMIKKIGEFMYGFSMYILEQLYETNLLYPLEEVMID